MKESVSKSELLNYDTIKFDGKIHLITFEREARKLAKYLKKFRLLGFDTESVPYKRRNIKDKLALIQICSEKECFLFKVRDCGIPDELIEIFTDNDILKVGVAIKGDLKEIKSVYGDFKEQNFLDLQNFVKDYGIKDIALTKISAIVLGKRVSKRQQRSNWGKKILDQAQIIYAATDAWVPLLIYKKLTERK